MATDRAKSVGGPQWSAVPTIARAAREESAKGRSEGRNARYRGPTRTSGPPRYTLTLEAAPDGDGPPAGRRLASLLKRLKRTHGFTCLDVRPADSANGQGIPGEASINNDLQAEASAEARAKAASNG